MSKEKRQPFAIEPTLQEWADTLRDVLVDLEGMSIDVATRVARETVIRFSEDHRSEQAYIAKAIAHKLDGRDLEIYRRYNGTNINALSREYKVSPRHIRRIAKRGLIIDRIVRDDDLFGGLELPEHY